MGRGAGKKIRCYDSVSANNLNAVQGDLNLSVADGHLGIGSLHVINTSVTKVKHGNSTVVRPRVQLYEIPSNQGDDDSSLSEDEVELVVKKSLAPTINESESESAQIGMAVRNDHQSDTVLTVRSSLQRPEKHRLTWTETVKAVVGEVSRHGMATFVASVFSVGIQAIGKAGLEKSPRITQLVTGSLTAVANGIAGIQVGQGCAAFIWGIAGLHLHFMDRRHCFGDQPASRKKCAAPCFASSRARSSASRHRFAIRFIALG